MANTFHVNPIDMRVLDSRLGDKVSDRGSTDFVVPENYAINDVVAKIHGMAKEKPINRLTLICHGIGMMVYGDMYTKTGKTVVLPGITSSDPSASVCKIYGGYGLELGKEGLSLENVDNFRGLKGSFSCTGVFVICGCAAADTGPTYTDPSGRTLTGDGPKLMRALAAATGASVIAAVRLQTAVQNWYARTADRAAFVGPTYLFTPDGRQTLNAASY